MEAIQIRINYATLAAICAELEVGFYPGARTAEQKVVTSIMAELSKKLEKTEINKRNTPKKFRVSFKYHEAFALERFCRGIYQEYQSNVYTAHAALDVANQIHKEL